MRRHPLLCVAATLALVTPAPARSASHPPGVTYPLRPATLQPTQLAHPLPSTRRYVLVWNDQLIPDGYSAALKQWVVTHYVGTQKLFKRQIDDYRTLNPDFMMMVYHLAYGLNGADQTSPVGNITGPNTYGQEDTDTFTPWVTAGSVPREPMYQHYTTPASVGTRVAYPDPYWLMEIASADWRRYLSETLLAWSAYPAAKADGIFFDVAFPPWYAYTPDNWWTEPAGGSSRQALIDWWNPRATAYFNALRTALGPAAGHPRYLVIPNTDTLTDFIDEPEFLAGTDGAFTENWQGILAGPGDWNLSTRRLCHHVTGHAKVWMVDVTVLPTSRTQAERELLIGTFFLIRNGTSYIMLGGGSLGWFPEYELDLGGYLDEPPDDLETLRVAGTGGGSGGLYVRAYASGVVVVNSSAGTLAYQVPSPMKRAAFSGGGVVGSDGTQVAQTLTFDTDVPAGPLSVPASGVVFLRSPSGAPPPGVEPGDGQDDGAPSADGLAPQPDGPAGGEDGPPVVDPGIAADGGPAGETGASSLTNVGCGCGASSPPAGLALLAFALRRRARRRP